MSIEQIHNQDKSEELWPSSGGWGASIWTGELRYEIEDFERMENLISDLNKLKKEHDSIRCECHFYISCLYFSCYFTPTPIKSLD